MNNLLAVVLGGAVGSVGRYLIGGFLNKNSASLIPLGTLSVNVIGSFIIGLVWVFLESGTDNAQLPRHFIMIGVLGGFTTFSAFSLETIQLVNNAHWVAAFSNMVLNLVGCLLAVAAGILIGKMLTG